MKQKSLFNKIGIIPILLLLVTSISFTSCYPDYGLSNSDFDVIVTEYEKTTDFSKYKTFAIEDSVFHITGDESEPDSEYLNRVHDAFILQTVTANMLALGYTQVFDPPSADSVDVVISVSALGAKVDQYYYYGGYWGWGYPGYGWGYPGYWGSTTYYVGTLFINYVDADNIKNPIIDLEWHAVLNGLLNNDSYSVTQSRLEDRINRAFDQSPYLEVSN